MRPCRPKRKAIWSASSTTCHPWPTSPRRRHHAAAGVIPFLVMLAFLAVAAGSTVSLWHALQIPWLLVAVIAFFLWHRLGHRRDHR